ncbi:MAG TPA: helix-turn-helix domain-containing protein, partial [Devosiaceae bacterium]|nr:helix-turn-helix domain-containing protein [Devosiaceae bacterium]
LVIVRDLLVGKRRFNDFLASRERITTSVLTDRLEQLEAAGLVERHAYQQRPERFEYRLTASGRDLLPVLQELCRWAEKHLDGVMEPPMGFMSFSPLPGEDRIAK